MSTNLKDVWVFQLANLMARKLGISATTPFHQLRRLFTEKFPDARIQICTKNGKVYPRCYANPIPPTEKQLNNWRRFCIAGRFS